MIELLCGDALELLKNIPDSSIDHCITDPPYSIDFDKKHAWDRQNANFHKDWTREVYRILKPGSFIISFSATQTQHIIASAIEDNGFKVKDTIVWTYKTGFAKNNRVDDKFEKAGMPELAQKWKGYGMILKPAFEPIIIAQKPFKGALYKNCEEYNVGAFHIDAIRDTNGYFPSNVWEIKKPSKKERNAGCEHIEPVNDRRLNATRPNGDADQYNTKHHNSHPTLKPIQLMEKLIKLIYVSGNTIIDPFCGSGTTLIAAQNLNVSGIGIEMNSKYIEVSHARLDYWKTFSSNNP